MRGPVSHEAPGTAVPNLFVDSVETVFEGEAERQWRLGEVRGQARLEGGIVAAPRPRVAHVRSPRGRSWIGDSIARTSIQ
jgi:hypothetical protein